MSEVFYQVLDTIFSIDVLVLIILSVLLGILIGAIPGLGPATGMVVVLPLTLQFGTIKGMVILMGVFNGSMYAGSIPAIVINTPGHGAAAATTLDGFPLAKKGKAKTALALSATSSVLGGTITFVSVLLAIPILLSIVLMFRSHHFFLIALFGLSIIIVLVGDDLLKGIIAGCFGLLLATIGIAPISGRPRYTLGLMELQVGISFIAALLGMFAIAEMIKLMGISGSISEDIEIEGSIMDGVKYTFKKIPLVLLSGFVGMVVGLVPGAGGSISTFVSHGLASKIAKKPRCFGDGDQRGVISAEAANNGSIGGSIVPTIAFGVPGSGGTAVLLGGLLMHGLQPGPSLFSSELDVTYIIYLTLIIGNVVVLIVGLLLVTRLSYITKIDTDIIIPIVIILSVLGIYESRGSWIDILSLFIFGVVGYYMVKYKFSVIAFVLGIVLGPIAERQYHRSMQISDGSYYIFVGDPIALILSISIILLIFGNAGYRIVKMKS